MAIENYILTNAQLEKVIQAGVLVDARQAGMSADAYAQYEKMLREKYGFTHVPPIYIYQSIEPNFGAYARMTPEGGAYFIANQNFLKAPPEVQLGLLEHETDHILNRDVSLEKLAEMQRNPALSAGIEQRADIEGTCIGGHPEWLIKALHMVEEMGYASYQQAFPQATLEEYRAFMKKTDPLHPSISERIATLENEAAHMDQVCRDHRAATFPPAPPKPGPSR